ncbi:MAG: hypothetical protein H0W21_11665 [Actinobacteria bacterium]|nr:hypothetical protein [Actinomycetota bacterium]
MASVLCVGAAAFMWLLFPGGSASESSPPGSAASSEGAGAVRSDAAETGPVATRLYAVEVNEGGLPPHTEPGSQLELWVSRNRPDPERPKLKKLLPVVTLDEMIPAFTSGGPDAAILRVAISQIPRLIQAERQGTLEVRLPSSRPVE